MLQSPDKGSRAARAAGAARAARAAVSSEGSEGSEGRENEVCQGARELLSLRSFFVDRASEAVRQFACFISKRFEAKVFLR